MRRATVGFLIAASALVAASGLCERSAAADERPAGSSKRGEITLPVTQITGVTMRPQVALLIDRIKPDLMLVVLKEAFLERISESIVKGPF